MTRNVIAEIDSLYYAYIITIAMDAAVSYRYKKELHRYHLSFCGTTPSNTGEVTVEVGMADDMMFRHDDGAAHFQHLPTIHPGLIRFPPVPVVHPVPNDLPPFPVSEGYVTGFSECAEETIRYLREVEGLSHDDPFIVGLQQHLLEKQRFLQLSLFLQNNLLLRAHVPNDDCVSSATKVNSDTSTMHVDTDRDNSSHYYTCNNECNTERHMQYHDNTLNVVAEDSEQLVSNLVEELYSLLQGEDIDFDSDDEIDEGFDEMKEQEVFS